MKFRNYGTLLVGLSALGFGCSAGADTGNSQSDEANYSTRDRAEMHPWTSHNAGASSAGSAGSDIGSAGSALGRPGSSNTAGSAGDPGTPSTPGSTFAASVTSVTSTSATIEWSVSEPATATRVFVGSEPAATADGPLADQKLVSTLDGQATSQKIEGIAPATDLFVRVERDTQAGVVRDDIHVRTGGGQRAKLDDAVREVHSFGSQVLEVVLANGSGAEWQSSGWTVTRADGKAVPVTAVKRHSIPVSAPEYTVGWGKPYSDQTMDVDHRIFLQLGEPLGSHDLFHVTGPGGVDMTVPFSDRYTETPIIQLNQVGYNPRATERWAYVSGWMGDGGPISFDGIGATAEVLEDPSDSATPRTVALASSAITPRSANDTWAGGEVRQIDLAQLPAKEGARYRIRIPGVGVSWPTAVSEQAALKSFYVVARGLAYNRWGVELKSPWSQFQRPADHTTIFTAENTNWTADYTESTPKNGQRQQIGGYHDAGDFDQRPMHTVIAEVLLRAFELHPDSYADSQLNLPESGNGVPDILDEALWGVSGWAQLQEADGGVRAGAQSYRHPWGFYHANEDPIAYWTYARDANVSTRAAGLFAQASRLLKPFDATRAADLSDRAARAWSWGSSHGASSAFRLHAAGELFRLTGDATYKTAFEQAWSQLGPSGAFSKFASEQLYMGDYTGSGRATANSLIAYISSQGAAPEIQSQTVTSIAKIADGIVDTLQTAHAHRHPLSASRPQDWGNATTTAKFSDAIIARLQLGNLTPEEQQRYFNALSLSADWVLGGNPNGYVYITGLGSKKVQEPLHLDSLSYAKEGLGVMPGIPVYGPVESAPGSAYSAAAVGSFYPSFNDQPKGMRYGDVRTLTVCSEFTSWETQAPHTALFAALMGPATTPPASWQPGQSDHLNPLP